MSRWYGLVLTATLLCVGCRSGGYYPYAYGPACVPPPGTGAIGTPYYQAPTYQQAPAYQQPSLYPSLPTYQTPALPPTTATVLPGPYYADSGVSVAPYATNEGAWSSSAGYVAGATYTAPAYASDDTTAGSGPLQPRQSGELIASGQRFTRNENLTWGSGVAQASYGAPIASSSVATATYAPPVYDAGVQYAAPAFGTEYVLDPYAGAYPSHFTAPVNVASSDPGWTPRQ